jgi:hypothetical protein
VRNCAGQTISLGVFCAKVRTTFVHLFDSFSCFCTLYRSCLHFWSCVISCVKSWNLILFSNIGFIHSLHVRFSYRYIVTSKITSQLFSYTPFRLSDLGQGQKIREVYISIPSENPTLGISLQWSPLTLAEDVWHILDVAPNSPADVAGLLPYGDYVIGSPEGLVRGESGLGELVEDFMDRPLRLIVYNHEYDVTRPVTITPSRGWGGEGALGCVLGFGALHRIPASLEEPPQAPGETLFSSDAAPTSFDEKRPLSTTPSIQGAPTELFVPANMALPSRSPPPPGGNAPPRKKGRAHHVASPAGGGGLDDYFKEGEEKSLAVDNAPKAKSGGVPPPPKAGGGPPRAGPPKSGSATPVPDDNVPAGEDDVA